MTSPPVSTEPPLVPLVPGRSRRHRAMRSFIEWVVIIGGALAVAFVVKTYLVQVFFIPSDSMLPTLERNDRVVVNKFSFNDVQRGDIVVFERPECAGSDETIRDLIKRVVALEGETVEGRDGHVLINGKTLEEPYLSPGTTTIDFAAVTVPADHVWLMGDNRPNSKDSRFLCGRPTPIAEDALVGRAFIRIWPLGRAGRL